MADAGLDLKPLKAPGEVVPAENGSKYEEYKPDGVYEYDMLPNGRPNRDHVKITYNHGDVYEGGLKHGKHSGNGKYTWEDGGTYEGEFQKGKLTGKGKYTAENGDVFEGQFKNNKYDGNGKYTWADGSKFEGSFKDGRLISGKYTDTEGNVYSCSYTYKRNGERKNGSIRLIKFAPKKENHEKKKAAKKEPTKKGDLLSKDTRLIAAIKKTARGAEFKNLYSAASGKDEKAEKSLIAILDFFTNSDAEQIQRIYKSSKLYDDRRSPEHLTSMIDGVIKDRKDFTKSLKTPANGKQATATAAKSAAR